MPLLNTDKLIFVYNADSGVFNLFADMAHKFFSPDTYNCRLCMLTHGHLGMQDRWKEYLATLAAQLIFLHRDEFYQQYGQHLTAALPAMFLDRQAEVELIMPESEMNACDTLDALIHAMDNRLVTLP